MNRVKPDIDMDWLKGMLCANWGIHYDGDEPKCPNGREMTCRDCIFEAPESEFIEYLKEQIDKNENTD